MKIWIGICLMWLMVRVVSAVPTSSAFPASDLQSVDQGLKLFSSVRLALSDIPTRQITGDARESRSVLSIIKSYGSFEEIIRGPIPKDTLIIPEPLIPLTGLEQEVYRVLAVQYLYPEYRLVFEIGRLIHERVRKNGWFIDQVERAKAQDYCFKRKNLSQSCLLEQAFNPAIEAIIDSVNELYNAGLESKMVRKEIVNLINRKGADSVYFREGFIADGAHYYQAKYNTGFHISLCLTYPKRFYAWELVGRARCEGAFKSHFEEKFSMDKSIQIRVLKHLFDPYSYFQLSMVSLSEEVLDRGVLCYNRSCVNRKITERMNEWTYRDLLDSAELRRVIHKISELWRE